MSSGTTGGELIPWCEDGSNHTLVVVPAVLVLPLLGVSCATVIFAIYTAQGALASTWDATLNDNDSLRIDSREHLDKVPSTPFLGTLAIRIRAESADADEPPRGFALVDWFSDDGAQASFHSGQTVMRRIKPVRWTEIVLESKEVPDTTLIISNGPEAQSANSIRLTLRDHRGQRHAAHYPPALAPFSLHQIRLGELFGDVKEQDGGHVTVEGEFDSRTTLIRPYVMTYRHRKLIGGFHGGDRHGAMRSIPRVVHQELLHRDAVGMPRELMMVVGQREMNPAYVVCDETTKTRVYLFQSHGTLDDDFHIDASIYDAEGGLVAHHERVAMAPRRGANVLDITELVGARTSISGHVALRFSRDDSKEFFPGRLQALMEYRTDVSVARVMLWSDRWNAPDRLASAAHLYRAAYRTHRTIERETTLAITNPGVSGDYAESAEVTLRLSNGGGSDLSPFTFTLAPRATFVTPVNQIFPKAAGVGLMVVESCSDLATIQLTRDLRSGALAAEHFMAVAELRQNNDILVACGS